MSNAASWAEVFAPIEAHNRNVVMSQTWGHLYPEPRKKYYGFIIFTFTEWREITPIKNEFKDLPDSPWFLQDQSDFIGDYNGIDGEVYKFEGYYQKFKNQNFRFIGKIKKVKIN